MPYVGSASSQHTQTLTPQDLAENFQIPSDQIPLLTAIAHLVEQATNGVAAVRAALGPDALIPYGDFLKANSISYELGQKLRDSGQLKVLRVGGKLMVRKGAAAEFVRNLPLD